MAAIKAETLTNRFEALASTASKAPDDYLRADIYTKSLLINLIGGRDLQVAVTCTDSSSFKKITLGDFFTTSKPDGSKYLPSDIREIKIPRTTRTITVGDYAPTKGGLSREISINKSGEPNYTIVNGVYTDHTIDYTFTDLNKVEAVYDPTSRYKTYTNDVVLIAADGKVERKVETVRPKDLGAKTHKTPTARPAAVVSPAAPVSPAPVATSSSAYSHLTLDQLAALWGIPAESTNPKATPVSKPASVTTEPVVTIKEGPADSRSDSDKKAKKHTGLKVGLGIGIPVLIAAAGAIVLTCATNEYGQTYGEAIWGKITGQNAAQILDGSTDPIMVASNSELFGYHTSVKKSAKTYTSPFEKAGYNPAYEGGKPVYNNFTKNALGMDRSDITKTSAGSCKTGSQVQ